MTQEIKTTLHSEIGKEWAHESAHLHVTGHAEYVDDIPELEGTLHAALGLSTVARGHIKSTDFSDVLALDGVEAVLTAKDIPGENRFGIIIDDERLLPDSRVAYWGQPLFVVVAQTYDIARRAARLARIEYEAETPLLAAEEAISRSETVVPARTARDGEPEPAIRASHHVISGHLKIGGQEHFYLEGQAAYAIPGEDRRMTIFTSSQHPSEMQAFVARILGWPSGRVTALCRRMGGAFGGKESQSYYFACLAALGAFKLNRPVKLRLDRDDDFMITGKRHAFDIDYMLAANKAGQLTAAVFEHRVSAGHSADYSGAVSDRAMFDATNAYFVPNFTCTSHRARTNIQSATAFRGFGGPQGMLGMEVAMETLALRRGEDPLDLRKRNLLTYGTNARLHYDHVIEDNVLPDLIETLESTSDYRRRRTDIDAHNAANPIIKKGICLLPAVFGVGFGATFLNQAGALVNIYADGSILVNHGGTEMGQGLNTKMLQIASNVLGVSPEKVIASTTDTSKVPNTVSTAASSGTDLNGMAVYNAAICLRERLATLATQLFGGKPEDVIFADDKVHSGSESIDFPALCEAAFFHQISLSATGYYRVPKVGYDFETFKGRPFHYYVYGAACSEVALDTLTGETRVLRVDMLQDVGKSINPALDRGQAIGAFVQGMGWMTTEELVWRDDGFLATHAPQTYKIPTGGDVPEDFRFAFFDNENREETIYKSKAVGEPPLKLSLSVFLAIWDAVASSTGRNLPPQLSVPATPEAILNALEIAERNRGV